MGTSREVTRTVDLGKIVSGEIACEEVPDLVGEEKERVTLLEPTGLAFHGSGRKDVMRWNRDA